MVGFGLANHGLQRLFGARRHHIEMFVSFLPGMTQFAAPWAHSRVGGCPAVGHGCSQRVRSAGGQAVA